MRLVEDQDRVSSEVRVGLDLGEENPVGHELDPGVPARVVVEPHFAAHLPAPGHPELLGNPLGHTHRRHPPRLGAADLALRAKPGLKGHLGQLRRFSRAGLSRHNQHPVFPKRRDDFSAPCANRQIDRVTDLRERVRHGSPGPYTRGKPSENDFSKAQRGEQKKEQEKKGAGVSAEQRGGPRGARIQRRSVKLNLGR
jgi:hypothetical protein